ncbi:MAG: EF-hand domain-containing protein [Planctomycetota bacterium]
MSISIVTRVSAIAVLFASASLAQAQFGPNGKPGPQGKGPGRELLKRFDKNGDGKLDPTELAAARQAMQGQGFPGAGKGGPGMGKGPGGSGDGNGPDREAILKRFDKNGDGQLDETERAAARKAMEERGGAGPGNGPGNGPGREEILKRFDKDGDGKLNDEERAAAMKAREERKN